MWRRIHILTPLQGLLVASLSAASIALPVTWQMMRGNETSILRDFPWPHTFDPYLTFLIVFTGIVPSLLGYYHLGRIGFMVNIAAGFALTWVMAVCGMLCFWIINRFRENLWTLWFSALTFAACFLLTYALMARLHLRAAASLPVRDAQRKLRLLPS